MPQTSKLELINQLEEKGLLRDCIKNGLFPAKMLFHRDIFYYVDAMLRSGVRPKDAIEQAETSFNVCRATIYNALKGMS